MSPEPVREHAALDYMLIWPNPFLPSIDRPDAQQPGRDVSDNPFPRFIRTLERLSELLATNPPGSWLNRALGGPRKGEHDG